MQNSVTTGVNSKYKAKNIAITIALIIVTSIVAIISKNLLPSDVNVSDFDSIFVKLLSFPVVASLYFIMIYSHNAIMTKVFAKQTKAANLQVGWRLGLCFALIYFFGMQEVVVSASPYTEWGLPFVLYQFVMGIGEAVAAILLCIATAKFACPKKSTSVKPESTPQKLLLIVLIAVAFLIERTIACETGLIASEVRIFPIPHYLWTALFGVVLGSGFAIVYPVCKSEKGTAADCIKVAVLTIGLSWIIFNLFIGLIFKDVIYDLLLRSGLDVVTMLLASLLWFNLGKKRLHMR